MSDHEEEQAALQPARPPELEQATLDNSASECVADRLSKVDIAQPGERWGKPCYGLEQWRPNTRVSTLWVSLLAH